MLAVADKKAGDEPAEVKSEKASGGQPENATQVVEAQPVLKGRGKGMSKAKSRPKAKSLAKSKDAKKAAINPTSEPMVVNADDSFVARVGAVKSYLRKIDPHNPHIEKFGIATLYGLLAHHIVLAICL